MPSAFAMYVAPRFSSCFSRFISAIVSALIVTGLPL
jgi:hypothetical protein